MEPDRKFAVSTLRAVICLNNREEDRLRAILADDPAFGVKMWAQLALEKLLRKAQLQVDELARLKAET